MFVLFKPPAERNHYLRTCSVVDRSQRRRVDCRRMRVGDPDGLAWAFLADKS